MFLIGITSSFKVNDTLTNLLFCVGRISSSSSDGSGRMYVCKQIEAIVYYRQEYKMENVKYCITVNLHYIMINT